MSVICIGGVCVPYTAIVPLFFLGLKWLASVLAKFGLLPDSVAGRLGVASVAATAAAAATPPDPAAEKAKDSPSSSDEPRASNDRSSASRTDSAVTDVETIDQWNATLSDDDKIVVAKFTAEWCKPCKGIDPFYKHLAAKHPDVVFVRIDVDELDEVAAEHGVAMMPTFVAFKGERRLGYCTGASEDKLERLVTEHCRGGREGMTRT